MATGVEPRCPTCGAYVQGIINLPPCPSCSEKDREIERLRACVHSPQGLEKRGIAACMKLIATLRAERDKLREALGKAIPWIAEELKELGGCDHSVGICACADERLLEELRAALTPKEKCEVCGGSGRSSEQCRSCGGLDNTNPYRDCESCGGEGYYPCPACTGSGYNDPHRPTGDCPACHGTGKSEEEER